MAHKFNTDRSTGLESKERFQNLAPRQILESAGLKPGMTMADVGCGSGFFALAAAEIVGAHGKVWAVDIAEAMLEKLRAKQPPEWLEIARSEENSVPIPDSAVDFVLLVTVLHEAIQPVIFLNEIARIMRPGAMLLVIDWEKQSEDKGPPESERLSDLEVKNLLQQCNFTHITLHALTPSHYQILARR